MDNAAHTPGPWSFDHDWRRIPTIFGPDGRQKIASVEKHKRMATNPGVQEDLPERGANARLIAAGPAMYSYIASQAKAGDEKARKILEEIHASSR